MARPKKKLTTEEAKSLTYELWTRLRDCDFGERNLTGLTIDTRTEKTQEATRSIEALLNMVSASYDYDRDGRVTPLPVDFPLQVQEWIETYITADGWKRLSANLRQREATSKLRMKRSQRARMGPYFWGMLTAQLDIDKEELLNKLSEWLYLTESGQHAFRIFTYLVHLDQRREGKALLAEVFELDAHVVNQAACEAIGCKRHERAVERAVYMPAALAGKPKLLQLSRAFKKLPARDRLCTIAAPATGRKGQSLLQIAATGSVKEALEGYHLVHYCLAPVEPLDIAALLGHQGQRTTDFYRELDRDQS
jgi:hypothetical protein